MVSKNIDVSKVIDPKAKLGPDKKEEPKKEEPKKEEEKKDDKKKDDKKEEVKAEPPKVMQIMKKGDYQVHILIEEIRNMECKGKE